MKKHFLLILSLICLILGIIFRLWQITSNNFFLYDEGLWLNANRHVLDMMGSNPSVLYSNWSKAVGVLSQLSLGTGKALWCFLTNIRVFFVGAEGWFWVRLISAICGIFTLGLTYIFGKKFFGKSVGLVAMCLLALLPSHLYYSRIGLQESLTTLLFLSGFYFYLSSSGRNWRTFLSGFFFILVFFTNYRMIITPFLVLFAECYLSWSERKSLDWTRYIWNTTIFIAGVFGIGALHHGINTYVTFGWMFHQQDLAKNHFELLDLLSYPYYMFKLESVWWGLAFFGNIFLIFKKEWKKLFAFWFVVLQMIIFSLPQDKAVRFLCSAMPFMALASAICIVSIYETLKTFNQKIILGLVVGLLFVSHLINNFNIVRFQTDYETSITDLKQLDPDSKLISTQPLIHNLFVAKESDVTEYKNNMQYISLLYLKGYRYLAIDPQAYISQTKDGLRFSTVLNGPLEFLIRGVKPIKVYDHFSPALLERIVLEHNENFRRSLAFLKENPKRHFNRLYIYDMNTLREILNKIAQQQGEAVNVK